MTADIEQSLDEVCNACSLVEWGECNYVKDENYDDCAIRRCVRGLLDPSFSPQEADDPCLGVKCNECPVGCPDYEEAVKVVGVPDDWCRRECPFRVNGTCLPDADGRVCPPSLNPAGWGIRSSHGTEKQ